MLTVAITSATAGEERAVLDWPAIQARLAIVAEEFDVPQPEIERAMHDPNGAGLAELAGRHDLSLDWIVSGHAKSDRVSRTGSTR